MDAGNTATVGADSFDNSDNDKEDRPRGKAYNRRERRLIEQDWDRRERRDWRKMVRQIKREMID